MERSYLLSFTYILALALPFALSCKISDDTIIIDKDGPITKQDFRNIDLKRITSICIKGKNISSIEPGALCMPPNLDYLQIYPLPLPNFSRGTFRGCNNLKTIHSLGEFKLQKDVFIGLKNLEKATFWNARTQGFLDKDYFAGLKSLKELNILFSNFRKIPRDAFQYLKNLNKLELSYDGVEIIEKEAFRNLRKLTELDLSFNALANLQWNEFEGLSGLRKFFLSGTSNFPKNTKQFLANLPRNFPNITDLCVYEKNWDLRRNRLFYNEVKRKFTALKTVCGRNT